MKKTSLYFLIFSFLIVTSCKKQDPAFSKILDNYWEDYLKMYPLEATAYGDNRYNDQLPNSLSQEYIVHEKLFVKKYLDTLLTIDTTILNSNEKISYYILKWELELKKEFFKYQGELLPINQFDCLPLSFGQMTSGDGNQPFENKQDYENVISRMKGFAEWMSTAETNLAKGIETGNVLPQILCKKVIKQYQDLTPVDITKSIFYQPLLKMPSSMDSTDTVFKNKYIGAIQTYVYPAYQHMSEFLQKTYLPKCRTTHGWSHLPQGLEWYKLFVKKWTTTTLSLDEIYTMGLNEVKTIREGMEKIKSDDGFKGSLLEYFNYCNTDKKFMPFKTPKEVLDSFNQIYYLEKNKLSTLFALMPKTKFEIRQTEAFREATASAEYMPASEDGSRPGIFYTPIPHAEEFNFIGMHTLFLHEAIPGHHFQSSLQQENKTLPKFRRFIWYGAYGEGWALYAETLGKDLGLLQDNYQMLGHLSDAMLRAVRLVVDIGIHTGKISREDAIKYMCENMRTSEAEATQEVERYMANPGQALSYMVGKKKIIQLRDEAKVRLGSKFDIKKFHTIVLENGCVPLKILEELTHKMN